MDRALKLLAGGAEVTGSRDFMPLVVYVGNYYILFVQGVNTLTLGASIEHNFWQRVEAGKYGSSPREHFFNLRFCNGKFHDIKVDHELLEELVVVIRGRMLLDDLAGIK